MSLLEAPVTEQLRSGAPAVRVSEPRKALTDEIFARYTLAGRTRKYNGGVICRLHEVKSAKSPGSAAKPLARAREILSASSVLSQLADFRPLRPTQLSIWEKRPLPEGLLYRFVVEALGAADPHLAVAVHASGHSVDVLPFGVSKIAVVTKVERELAARSQENLAIITIGDQGRAGGNDALLLAQPLGLSVEHVSSDFNGCWNVAARSARRSVALLGYLNALNKQPDGSFRWSVAEASRPREE